MVFQECEPTGSAGNAKNKIQPFGIVKNDHESKKISACIRFHAELLHLLNFRQPLSTKELLSEIGFSKQKLLRDLLHHMQLEYLTSILEKHFSDDK